MIAKPLDFEEVVDKFAKQWYYKQYKHNFIRASERGGVKKFWPLKKNVGHN